MGFTKVLGAGISTETNIQVGVLSATKFVGDGSLLTNLPGGGGSVAGINTAGISTFKDLEVSGNVSIAGTLTYEDVKNVDSIGLITARSGINVVSGGINASGVVTATTFDGNLNASQLSSGTIPDARFPATLPAASAANLNNIPSANLTGALPGIDGGNLTNLSAGNLTGALPAIDGSNLTNLSAPNLTGALPTIDGSNLTNLSAGNLTGALPAIDGSALTGIGVGINSAGTSIATNVNTLNFVGAGNTFAYNSSTSTVDISISGGSGGGGGGGSAASAGSAINYPGGSVSPFVLSSVHITEDITLDNNNADSVPANVITGESTVTVDDGVTITIDEGKTVIPDLYNVLSDAYTAPA